MIRIYEKKNYLLNAEFKSLNTIVGQHQGKFPGNRAKRQIGSNRRENPGTEASSCSHSYSGGRGRRTASLGKVVRLYLKIK
jgi:hypothetical protein